jgi:hypothetical protein
MLLRWITTKPQGMAGTSAHACASPAMSAAVGHAVVETPWGIYGTGVSNGFIGRPLGRGGSAG